MTILWLTGPSEILLHGLHILVHEMLNNDFTHVKKCASYKEKLKL